jgi:hypothetical protein
MLIALENFFMLFVLPFVTMTAIILLFRWWMKRSTGYDPVGNKGRIYPTEENRGTRPESYAPYMPPKKVEDAPKQE